MLHLIPAPLHRLALRVGYRLRKAWWRLRRPSLTGVAMIARDADGRVLLVRLSYGTARWSLPGGGMHPGEDPAAAAEREFAEELGCGLRDIRLLGQVEDALHGARDHVFVFTGLVDRMPQPDRREVLAARFFDPADLPDELEKRVRPRLALLEPAAGPSA